MPILEGWLGKRGEEMGKAWSKRWFTLHPGGALTYSREKRGKVHRHIPLCASTQVRTFDQPDATPQARITFFDKPNGFEIYQGPGYRTWYLDAGSFEKCAAWTSTLARAIADLRPLAFGPCPVH